MEVNKIFEIFERNKLKIEIEEEIIEYLLEIITSNELQIIEKFNIINNLLESYFNKNIKEEKKERIINELIMTISSCSSSGSIDNNNNNNSLNINKQKNNNKNKKKEKNKKKKEEEVKEIEKEDYVDNNNNNTTTPITIPSTSSTTTKNITLTIGTNNQQQNKFQKKFQPKKKSSNLESESTNYGKLLQILESFNVSNDGIDETIADYLYEICSDENMSLGDLEEIILTYFPTINGDVNLAQQIIFHIIQSLTQNENSKLSTIETPLENSNCNIDQEVNINETESFETPESNDSDHDNEQDRDINNYFDELRLSEPTELSSIDVSDLSEIFPNLPLLSLQYLFHIKCHDNFTDTCQYLLDHQTEEDLQSLEELSYQYVRKYNEKMLSFIEEDNSLKKKIFDTYGDQVIYRTDSDKVRKRAKSKEMSEAQKMKILLMISRQSNQKVRYRDNKIATTKGEKIIVEKNPKDDYDGGSRGKVKTKGKRGPGFIQS